MRASTAAFSTQRLYIPRNPQGAATLSTSFNAIPLRRVRRALATLFNGAVGKDTVSRVWRKVKGDWDAWNKRSLAGEPIIRLILDGTVVRVRLDKNRRRFPFSWRSA